MKGASAVVMFICCAVISQSLAQTAKPTTSSTTKKPTTPKPKPTVPPAQLKCQVFNVTIKLTKLTFSDDFLNAHSKAFTDARIELEAGIHQAFDGYKPFTALKIHQFTKASDGKVLSQVFLEFKGNGTHLKNLIAAVAKGKLGILDTQPALASAGCYVTTPVPTAVCAYPCPTICSPDCGSQCCNQYQPPPPVMLPPPPPQCPDPCSPMCAPSCAPACCQTAYAAGPYGKRHHAPKPTKEDIENFDKKKLRRAKTSAKKNKKKANNK